MLNAMNTAVSGMRAQELQLNSTANNVANSQSEGYVPSDVTMAEGANGGVRAQLQKPVAAPGVAQEAETKPSQVDLAKEMVDMVASKPMYQANMKSVDTADQMTGFLLDTQG